MNCAKFARVIIVHDYIDCILRISVGCEVVRRCRERPANADRTCVAASTDNSRCRAISDRARSGVDRPEPTTDEEAKPQCDSYQNVEEPTFPKTNAITHRYLPPRWSKFDRCNYRSMPDHLHCRR